jgi:hypothetical protein
MSLELKDEMPLKWPDDRPLDAAASRLKNLSLIEKVGDRWQLKAQ